MRLPLRFRRSARSVRHSPPVARRATTYDWEMTPTHGVQNFTNLAFGGSLDAIDWAYGNHSIQGLWDFNGAEGGCVPNESIVIGEPYCGGATGLAPTWKVGVQWVVDQIKGRKSIAGLSLGDEPEIQGVPYAQMCELSTFLKATLIAAKREDVFIHYNDGPASGNLQGNGMCKGLDYFSIDSYRDDPAAEVAASKAAYASLIPKLRPPNTYEPKGQGLWVVPGIFWFMGSCTDKGGECNGTSPANSKCCASPAGSNADAGTFGGPPWCPSGTHCATSPAWLPGKLQAYWEWALTEPAIQGINPWHWSDRPSMSPTDGFARGGVSLGPQVRQWMEWIGANVSAAHPHPQQPSKPTTAPRAAAAPPSPPVAAPAVGE